MVIFRAGRQLLSCTFPSEDVSDLREREFHHFGKSRWVAHCEFGQDFSVDTDLLFAEAGYQLRVCRAVQPGGSVDTCNPQLTVGPLLRLAVTVGILHPLIDMVLGDREDFASRTPIAFCLREHALATAMGGNLVLRTWHSCSCP